MWSAVFLESWRVQRLVLNGSQEDSKYFAEFLAVCHPPLPFPCVSAHDEERSHPLVWILSCRHAVFLVNAQQQLIPTTVDCGFACPSVFKCVVCRFQIFCSSLPFLRGR